MRSPSLALAALALAAALLAGGAWSAHARQNNAAPTAQAANPVPAKSPTSRRQAGAEYVKGGAPGQAAKRR